MAIWSPYLPKPANAKIISNKVADDRATHAAGVGYALACYVFWGFAPAYFVLVRFAAPLEILAHRILWSLPLLALLITIGRQWYAFKGLTRREWLYLTACSTLLSINWLTFIYAITIERIAETALGYYINPLVSIVLGWLVLRERMRPLQWTAAAIALIAVMIELVRLGTLPWLALTLALSFGCYGLLRKQLRFPSSAGLGAETAMVAPLAAGYLVISAASGGFELRTSGELVLLALGGAVTVTPLIWFASAAARLPLTTLGFFQYLAPSITLMLAVVVYGETVPPARWYAFALIWAALALFTFDGLNQRRAWRAAGRPLT